jgi:hypothetical protein
MSSTRQQQRAAVRCSHFHRRGDEPSNDRRRIPSQSFSGPANQPEQVPMTFFAPTISRTSSIVSVSVGGTTMSTDRSLVVWTSVDTTPPVVGLLPSARAYGRVFCRARADPPQSVQWYLDPINESFVPFLPRPWCRAACRASRPWLSHRLLDRVRADDDECRQRVLSAPWRGSKRARLERVRR